MKETLEGTRRRGPETELAHSGSIKEKEVKRSTRI